MKRLRTFVLAIIFCVQSPAAVLALSDAQRGAIDSGVYYFNLEESPIGNACLLLTPGSNFTESGVFNQAQLEQIQLNRSIYEQAAQEQDIPWQMIAVIHARETGLKRENPSNGQGVYQFANGAGGPYPTGPVSEEEFLRQTKFMAERLKNDYSQRTPIESNRLFSANPAPDAIKDTFFSYNGRAQVYAQQAAQLGYDPQTQPFEGSPYVMNKADTQRDPAFNKTTWGQVKRDGGPIEYPANDDYGAFVMYAALAGISGNDCDQTLASRVVEIAKEELRLGANEADGSYLKYTGGIEADWCAYFVSWVFDKAGKPFEGGSIPQVATMREYAQQRGLYFSKTDPSYIPQPGDIVVYKENVDPYPSHVNIVISYDAATETITTIGGNETDTIKEATNSRNLSAISGFIRIN